MVISCRENKKQDSLSTFSKQSTSVCFKNKEFLHLIKQIITDKDCESCEKIVFVHPDALLEVFSENKIEGSIIINNKELFLTTGKKNIDSLPELKLVKKNCDAFLFELISREGNYIVKGSAIKKSNWEIEILDVIVIN